MCSIITIDSNSYHLNKSEFNKNLISEAQSNNDSFSALFVSETNKATTIRTESLAELLSFIDRSMSQDGRLFIHLRYATMRLKNVATSHCFQNNRGNAFIMHNGIIQAGRKLLNDSFYLKRFDDADKAFDRLLSKKETYANIFWIDIETSEYSVIRLINNTLYTDSNGNYSTKPFSDITRLVESNTIAYHAINELDFFEYSYQSEYFWDDKEEEVLPVDQFLKIGNE